MAGVARDYYTALDVQARACGCFASASRRTAGSCMASSGEPAGEARYAELHCLTNFTFLRGASHPHELVEQAEQLGYEALAITDECSVAGVVRAHMAAKGRG